MKTVGLRELKNRLSEYVRQVRSGESVLVTDRGVVVAELVPPGQLSSKSGLPPGLVAMARKGQLTIGKPNKRSVYRKLPRVLKNYRSIDLLNEERGER